MYVLVHEFPQKEQLINTINCERNFKFQSTFLYVEYGIHMMHVRCVLTIVIFVAKQTIMALTAYVLYFCLMTEAHSPSKTLYFNQNKTANNDEHMHI